MPFDDLAMISQGSDYGTFMVPTLELLRFAVVWKSIVLATVLV
jgi:hypothetical protein